MDYSKLLNTRQLEAVSTSAQFVRIIAGAGSGKTRVLTYRISYLISEFNVNPSSILAIAFTNKVAKEMKERVASLLPETAPYLNISTFHAFCAKFLRIESAAIGLPSGFVIMDEDDQEKLVKNIATSKGYQKKDPIVKEALNYICHHKTKGIYPEDVKLGNFKFANEKKCLEFFIEYEAQKQAMKCIDFDDLLLKTIIILSEFPEIRIKWQNKIKHILIDEFQDTNDVQYKLIKLLSCEFTNLYVVGDPDQTIYTWRGANQKIILDFERNFKNVETIILDRNYRSTKQILDTANKLISFNKDRVKKDLYTENQIGSKIITYKGLASDQEASWVIKQIERIALNNSYKNIAILYRSSYLTLPFEKELTQHQIPYKVFGGVRFYQRKEIKDALAYFRLIINMFDDVSFERIINVPKRGIGEASLDKFKKESKGAKMSLAHYILDIENHDTELKNKVINALTSIVNKIVECKSKLDENYETYSSTLKSFLEKIGYFDYLEREEDGEERIENVHQLFDDMDTYIKKNPDSSFESWLENAVLATSQDDLIDGDFVSLMTIHVAKGLEFDNVFVVGLNDGVFPNHRALLESGKVGLEEERRLCYVAFTRAKLNLFVTCNTGYSYLQRENLLPSQFVNEAGLSMIANENSNSKFFQPKPRYDDYYSRRNVGYDSSTGFESQDNNSPRTIKNNQNIQWEVGDEVTHTKFGYGVIKRIVNENIIIVDFVEYGEKAMLSKHDLLTRFVKGEA